MRRIDWVVVSYLHNSLFVLDYFLCKLYDSFSCLIVYFLCRLKINHDSHEFILEFGANNYSLVLFNIPLFKFSLAN
jgi:hypothetical protein